MPNNQRCTFAIISHPDAGKTTITEKLLLFGGAIQLAGTVKGRKAGRHATSDWMELEKQRGISVTTSVMQFPYAHRLFNLLDTPGHADFSEDTYRTLTAVDSALMVIDAVKGVETRTIKLMQVCRLRTTPIFTFINKLDREIRDPVDLLDEIESVLAIKCAPIVWPIGGGRDFKGIYNLLNDKIYLFAHGANYTVQQAEVIDGLDIAALEQKIDSSILAEFREQLELIKSAGVAFNKSEFLTGELTPVFFGSALNNFGVQALLDFIAEHAPGPGKRETQEREVSPEENKFTGFVFKIQANMDPNHRDRIAFMRVCSGCFRPDNKIYHVREKRQIQIRHALTFMAGERTRTDSAYPGDIVGLPNHGNIRIGDTFTEGEVLKFTGIPNFAPELFKVVRSSDPLKVKALQKGLNELSEEGATQVFRPFNKNIVILGAVGVLQFDVVAHRLLSEYKVDCIYEPEAIYTVRWVTSSDVKKLKDFRLRVEQYLGEDHSGMLVYLAPSRAHLELTISRWPEINFAAVREH